MSSRLLIGAGLLAAAAVGAAAAIAVDELVLEPDPAREARARAGEVVLTGSDVGTGWMLDASTELDEGDGDSGFLGGCASPVVTSGQGYFTALSSAASDVITSEVRILESSVDAAVLYDTATSFEAIGCVRRRVETEATEQYGAGVPIVAVIEPISAAPGPEQTFAYRVRLDVAGVPVRRVDVYVVRDDEAVGALEIFDEGEVIPLESVLRSIDVFGCAVVDDRP